MIKTTLFGSALAVALSVGPAMAGDFHALKGLQGATPAPFDDVALAATEGGAECTIGIPGFGASNGNPGGVCLLSFISHPGGVLVAFSVTNNAAVTGANFLQVTGF